MKTHENVSIGVIGCGNISSIYLQAPMRRVMITVWKNASSRYPTGKGEGRSKP